MSDKLARIHWQMGQALLPEHLVALEDSILAETRARAHLIGLPNYGIGHLSWNEALLSDGILSILAMTLVLPSGQLFDIPKNAKAKSFNMNLAGTTSVPVYLHIIEDAQGSEEMATLAQEEESVERLYAHIEISSDQNHASARHSIRLAEFQKDAQGTWKISDQYIPPLLQVGTSPFLGDTLNYMVQLLEAFHFKLSQEITASHLSGENLFSAKQCLQGIYKLQHFMCNLKGNVHYHPYYLYETLKFFYIDLCLYQNCTPETIDVPYHHDQLADCFRKVIDPILAQMKTMKSQAPYLPFKKSEGMFTIAKLPKEAIDAKEVYFLIQKPKVTTTDRKSVV